MRLREPEEYQPLAREVYGHIALAFRERLPDATIEHIGSSAIAGAVSKGDLDVFVGVDPGDFAEAIAVAQGLGFRIKLDTLRTEQLCPFESSDYPLDVGVQLVERGSRYEFFREFRDRLNGDFSLLKQYNQVKRDAAALGEREYRARKSAFIERVLAVR